MKKLILLLTVSLTNSFYSQEKSIILKQEFKPNSHYTMNMITSVKGEMEFIGDEEFKKVIKEQTGSEKMQMESKNDVLVNITTSTKKNNETPFTWQYDLKDSFSIMNGKEIPSKNKDFFKNLEITGRYVNENVMKIDDIKGENIETSMKDMLKDIFQQSNFSVDFPKTALKIGDEFTQNTPLKMNIPSVGIMNFKIITKYKLVKIENGLAYLDLVQNFVVDSDIKLFNIDANGGGNGKAIFNQKENFMKSIITDLEMNMKIQLKDSIKLINNSKTHSEIITNKL